LKLKRFSWAAVVAEEKGELADGVMHSFFPAGRDNEGDSKCCIILFLRCWMPWFFMLLLGSPYRSI
jgi:hypothetical protein